MSLQAQPPIWMVKTIPDRHLSMSGTVETVHRLKKEMLERKMLELRRRRSRLRIHQLQFIPALLHQFRPALGAHADPVDPRRGFHRAVGLNRDLESLGMQGGNKARVELQQRLAARANHKS